MNKELATTFISRREWTKLLYILPKDKETFFVLQDATGMLGLRTAAAKLSSDSEYPYKYSVKLSFGDNIVRITMTSK